MDFTNRFGCRVFGDAVMKELLPEDIYNELKKAGEQGTRLPLEAARVVAQAMKDWAIEQGATHYSHWFQPMNSMTAGKLDSFLDITADGSAVADLSFDALVMSEPDASSFPSGGLRTTFEARGYTAWDPTSPAFVKDDTLYIPTAFCTYTGLAMDEKTPLLRSMQAVSAQALRLMKVMGYDDVTHVEPTVGAEQEYFLVSRENYESRLDLKICGRTLLGAKPSKGQELEDHYCGRIRTKVAEFMKEVDHELWELGVPSKTKHNEAAPSQHELAPIFTSVNIAADNNQLIMETLRTVAKRNGMTCLLHEKPFEGINGSGKYNNYSLSANNGINLLKPGAAPAENDLFLVTMCAFLQAVDQHADLLRMSASCPGNDYRLGGYEAPPAIISVFLGDALTGTLKGVAAGALAHAPNRSTLDTGVSVLPELVKDDSDRNRTSPVAFTGNKFEFRMLGSSQSISLCNVVLNTAVADALQSFTARLEKADDRKAEVHAIVADTMENHGRIIFNGNNYSAEWQEEAKRRGLPILENSVEAYKAMVKPENIELFQRHKVLSAEECTARYEIMVEHYAKVMAIEAKTLLEMVRRQVQPAVIAYAGKIADACNAMAKAAGVSSAAAQDHLRTLMEMIDCIAAGLESLDRAVQGAEELNCETRRAEAYCYEVRAAMENLRRCCDAAERVVDCCDWPMPTYTDLLHRI
ncbi:MAG: glutamine synthetase III [Oscillospiraceae bacterium]|nr:glutamine synthetase III [Oscillospiraceae bacterium]